MDFRSVLVRTLRAIEPVLRVPGVLVAGSQLPNLLEPGARATLVVSRDVDVAVPVRSHGAVKDALSRVKGLSSSTEEPSVWVPADPGLIEVYFIGMDSEQQPPGESYVLEDAELPLLVFRHLSLCLC